jgi:hypothetical protein
VIVAVHVFVLRRSTSQNGTLIQERACATGNGIRPCPVAAFGELLVPGSVVIVGCMERPVQIADQL